ncbi:WSC-domain-containing protein [Coprinopsis marcescibilis]|uniref:WSC-domain-containing protein n=1 Tax=Coprinopsis marcescibilis TaxID=230819 RepID=A0A5C3KYB1_COPMA|nr:WSC-domain-containing protein [Coprinopsis marcescibilis]
MFTIISALLASAALTIVEVHGHPPAPPGSAIKTTVGTWEYKGCYVDFGPRILNFRFDIPEGNTAERCTELCANEGYGIAGLEYGTECWCDNYNIFGDLPIVGDGDCNFACPGDEMEWCGAGNRLVVYENTAATPPSVNNCIDWRHSFTFGNTRLQAIPKTGSGLPTNLFAIPTNPVTDPVFYRIISTCTGSCPWTDYFNMPIVDGLMTAYNARAMAPNVGDSQAFRDTFPNTVPGHNGYCGKPNPISPLGGFAGFPVLSVNGDVDSWALCTNTTAGGRQDIVYSPIPNHAHYDNDLCEDVYIQILPYILVYP